jgi:hypothetical protein
MSGRAWAALVVAFALLAGSTPAAAGEHWCEEDPVLTIDGRTVDYTASFPQSSLAGATVNWTFHIPKNVLLATAITPPAIGSPSIPSTVRILRDLPAYTLLSRALVITTVTVTGFGSFPTVTSVRGLNAAWTTYGGTSGRALTFSTSFSALPLLY